MVREVKVLRWMYCGLTIDGKKEAGSGLTTAQIAKVTGRQWLVFDVKSYHVKEGKRGKRS